MLNDKVTLTYTFRTISKGHRYIGMTHKSKDVMPD